MIFKIAGETKTAESLPPGKWALLQNDKAARMITNI